MPVTPTYPGVYIQELASDVRTIVPVDTATTAFIGKAQRGPVNQPVTIFSFEEFEQRFGRLSNDSKLGFAVRDFFLNGGAKAVIVRVYRPLKDTEPALARLPIPVLDDTSTQTPQPPPDEAQAKTRAQMDEAQARLQAQPDEAQARLQAQMDEAQARFDAAKKADDAVQGQLNEAKGQLDGAKAVADTTGASVRAQSTAASARVEALAEIAAATSLALKAAQAALNLAQAAINSAEASRDRATKLAAAQAAVNRLESELDKALKNEQTVTGALDWAKAEKNRLESEPLATSDTITKPKPKQNSTEGGTPPDGQPNQPDEKQRTLDTLNSATALGSIARLSEAKTAATSERQRIEGELNQAREDLETARGARALSAGIALQAASAGHWGEKLVLRVTKVDGPGVGEKLAAQYGVKAKDLFNLTIRDTQTDEEEHYPNVTLVEGPRRLDRVLANESQLVQVAPGLLNNYSGPAPLAHNAPSKDPWWESNGCFSKVTATTSDDALGTGAGDDEAVIEAIHALDHTDIFNMLCIPPYSAEDSVSFNVLADAAAYCTRRRAILIVDPPPGWKSVDDAIKGFPSRVISPTANAAIYFPRIKKPNPLRENQVEEFAPCGAVAGVIARTDLRRGVWKAPAGLEATLNGVVGLSVPLDDNHNGLLNPLGINCLRVMPAAGPVVWGARTTEGDDRLASQWKYLPVRRMALWIEETLYRSTHWAVFEPNDEPLWSSLRMNIGNFMGGLFRQGAFQGRTPAEAYFVRCDASTTTQTDIDRGIVNVIVGFAPLKPAEFVIISIKQITNQGAA